MQGLTLNEKGIKNSVKLLQTASIAALSLSCFSTMAYAQDAEVELIEDDEPVDEVVVQGFRRSLADALDEKRNSGNIVDGINAEDIGKSADQNIADALQRVTGIAIERSEGEGSTVTVRGVDANLNNVTVNGVTVTNAAGDVRGFDAGQAVDFSVFSADLISRVEVAKTASADDNEGSLGATIRLETFSPLDSPRDRRVLAVQARYSEFADESFGVGDDIFGGDYRANLSFSQKLFNDTIGFSVIATSERTSGRRDEVSIDQFNAVPFGNNLAVGDPVDVSDEQALIPGVQDLPGGITDLSTGQTVFNGDEPISFLIPRELGYRQSFFQNTRHNVTGTLQWRPSERTDIRIDATYTLLNRLRNGSEFRLRPFLNRPIFDGPLDANGVGNAFDPEIATLINFRQSAFRNAGNPIPGVANNVGFQRPTALLDDNSERTFVIGFDIEQELGDFTVNLKGGRSDSQFGNDDFIFSQAQLLNGNGPAGTPTFFGNGPRPLLTRGFDCERDGSLCTIFLEDTVPNRTAGGTLDGLVNPDVAIVDDPGELIFGAIGGRDQEISDESLNFFLDFDWNKSFGPITSFEFGGKYENRNRVQQGTFGSLSRFNIGVPEFQIFPIVDFVDSEGGLVNGFGTRLGLPRDNITDGTTIFDAIALRSFLQEQAPNAGVTLPALQNFRDIEFDIYGGYVKANFALLNERLSGDFGVRWVRTEVNVAGGAVINPSFGGFTNDADSLAVFGFLGEGNPDNTATFEEAQASLIALFGEDLVQPGQAGFVQPGASPSGASNSFSNFLPSFNANWFLKDNLVLRFGASRTLARPTLDRFRSNFVVNENPFSISNANSGNPFLDPFTSFNLDLSAEWYFDENSLFSVAFFNKSLRNSERLVTQFVFVRDPRLELFDANGVAIDLEASGAQIDQADFLLPFTPDNPPLDICLPLRQFDVPSADVVRECAPVQFTRPINAGDAFVRGIEVALQHNFTYLPGFLSGFGFTSNYTYANSEVAGETIPDGLGGEQVFRDAPLPNTSAHTFNVTGFYETNKIQLRAAFNTRSDFLLSTGALPGGTRVFVEGNSTLDVSGGYNFSDKLAFTFQLVNLLDTRRREFAVVENGTDAIPEEALTLGDAPDNRFFSVSNTGRIFRFGLRAQF